MSAADFDGVEEPPVEALAWPTETAVVLLADQIVDDGDVGAVVPGPVEGQCAGTGGAGHAGPQVAIAAQRFHPRGQSGDVARAHDKSLETVADHRAGLGRDHAWQAARQGFIGNDGRTLEQRWEHEYVCLPQSRGHFSV